MKHAQTVTNRHDPTAGGATRARPRAPARLTPSEREWIEVFDLHPLSRIDDWYRWGRVPQHVYVAYLHLWNERRGYGNAGALPEDTQRFIEAYRELKAEVVAAH
jgi:hypothetical protein